MADSLRSWAASRCIDGVLAGEVTFDADADTDADVDTASRSFLAEGGSESSRVGILVDEGGAELGSRSFGSSKGLKDELGVSREAGDEGRFASEGGS